MTLSPNTADGEVGMQNLETINPLIGNNDDETLENAKEALCSLQDLSAQVGVPQSLIHLMQVIEGSLSTISCSRGDGFDRPGFVPTVVPSA